MIERYNVEFPDGTTDASIELHCYRWGSGDSVVGYIPGTGKEQWEHLFKAITLLWPERMEGNKKGYIVHDWTIPRLKAWCELGKLWTDDVWWGPSSVGKTVDAAVIVLADWFSAPDKTATHVISTGLSELKLRIFGEIAKFHGLIDGAPGVVVMSDKPCIKLGDENSKNGIFGHAVHKGNVDQAMNKLIGIHNEYNRLVIDEFQGTLPAAVAARTNLASGREFKFLGMGNPQSRLDPMGRHSEPINGWDSVSPDCDSWRTKYGMVHFWDGLKSPGVRDPKRYWFLLTQKLIDETIAHDGRDSVQFWSQRRGWIPPEGLIPVVMSESFIVKFKMQEPAIWKFKPQIAAGFDPAYSSDGDNAILYPFEFGMMSNDVFGINWLDPINIELGAKEHELMAYHICDQVKGHCKRLGITPENFAMDCTGTQGPLADVIEKEWGRGMLRVMFGGKASEKLIEEGSIVKGTERYKNRVTELWYSMNYFGKNGHVRGLSDKAVLEFTQRRLKEYGTPVLVESKKDMKGRTGESPDTSDAAVVGLEWVRVRCGFQPGEATDTEDQKEETEKQYKQNDLDADSLTYLSSGV